MKLTAPILEMKKYKEEINLPVILPPNDNTKIFKILKAYRKIT